MGTEFISENVWQRITAAVKKKPGKCAVAVAYFGRGAAKRLPLKKGSTLVVNMSDSAIKSGVTDPRELLKLIRKGVAVYTVGNLHAKSFVVGDEAFVGSANASDHSANHLIESCIRTDSRQIVKATVDFISSLNGEFITPEFAKTKENLFRPPQFVNGGTRTKKARRATTPVTPSHAPVWVVPLEDVKLSAQVEAERQRARTVAHKRLRSTRQYKVDDFTWNGGDFVERLAEGDLVVQQVDRDNHATLIYPSERVIYPRRFKIGRVRHAVFCLESPKNIRGRNLNKVVDKLGRSAKFLKNLDKPTKLTDPVLVHRLLNLLPKSEVG